MFIVAKGLQAAGIAYVAYGIWAGVTRDDLWAELYMALLGLAVFGIGRLLERRA